jgi:hypothetical protein
MSKKYCSLEQKSVNHGQKIFNNIGPGPPGKELNLNFDGKIFARSFTHTHPTVKRCYYYNSQLLAANC